MSVFGRDSNGSSQTTCENYILGSAFPLLENAIPMSICAYINWYWTGTKIKFAICRKSDNKKIMETAELTKTTPDGDEKVKVTVEILNRSQLSPDLYYLVGLADRYCYIETSDGTMGIMATQLYVNGFPDILAGIALATEVSICCIYEPVATVFSCQFCSLTFNSQSELDIHIATAHAPVITTETWLHVENGKLKDRDRNIVQLRGIVRDGYTTSCSGFWQPFGSIATEGGYADYNDAAVRVHLQQIKNLGLNTVRLLLCIDWWKNNSATSYDGRATSITYREAVKKALTIAVEMNIHVILCWYAVKVPAGGNEPLPYGPNNTVIANAAEWTAFMLNFAIEIRDYPNVIYEVWNEPHGELVSTVWLSNFMDIIDAIRASGDGHILMFDYGYCGGFDLAKFATLKARDLTGNIVYGNHIYRYPSGATMSPPFDPSGTTEPATYSEIMTQLTTIWNYQTALDANVPIVITECGGWQAVGWNQTRELEFYSNIFKVLDFMGIGYTANHWDNPWVSFKLQDFSQLSPFPLDQYGEAFLGTVPTYYTCSICGMTFATQPELDSHITASHPVTPPTQESGFGVIAILAAVILLGIAAFSMKGGD